MTGNPGLDKILLGLNGIVVALAAALIVYSHTMIKPQAVNQNAEYTNLVRFATVENQKAPVVFKNTVVNLYSRESRLRFLDVEINVEVYQDGMQTQVQNIKPILFDTLIDIAGNTKPEDLNSVTGKILLESRLKTKVNELINKKLIKQIYFSKFIIQ
jgi:flagellar protein FliL